MSGPWYVVYTHANAERTALTNLCRQGMGAYLPVYLGERRHARRVERVARPLFPRYLFVAFDPAATRWRAILSTVGVSSLVCRDGLPAPVPPGVVEKLRALEGADGMVRLPEPPPIEPGRPVRMLNGAFIDRVGLCQGMSDGDRVVVLLDILGRPVRATVRRDEVAPVH
ncbi:MAG: transcriptional activator RfaH [Pseudomonadota bacterium]